MTFASSRPAARNTVARRLLPALCLAWLLSACMQIARAEAPQAPAAGESPRAVYAFAAWLFSQKDYQRAVTEFKRAIFFTRDEALREDAVFMVASCYQAGDQWARALAGYRDYLQIYPEGRHRENAMFRTAQCAFGMSQYRTVKDYVDLQLTEFPEGTYADDADFLVSLAYLMSRDWVTAGRLWRTQALRRPDSPLNEAAAAMAGCCEALATMPRKSPARAMLMAALIPGSGHVYAGSKGDGITAFLVNVVTIGFAVNRFERKDNAAGVIMTLIGLTFYTGNIYGAANAAQNRNERAEAELLGEHFARARQAIEQVFGHPEELVLMPPAPAPQGDSR